EFRRVLFRSIDKMITKLDEKLPTYKEYYTNIDEKLYYSSTETKQKKLVQYVLKKIEFYYQNNNVDVVNTSLEHIYPENPNGVWNELNESALFKNIEKDRKSTSLNSSNFSLSYTKLCIK